MVWNASIISQIYQCRQRSPYVSFRVSSRTKSCISPILHVNQESRDEALKIYKVIELKLTQNAAAPSIERFYFSKFDTFYIPRNFWHNSKNSDYIEDFALGNAEFIDSGSRDFANHVRHLAFDHDHMRFTTEIAAANLVNAATNFKNLQTITVVMRAQSGMIIGDKEPKILGGKYYPAVELVDFRSNLLLDYPDKKIIGEGDTLDILYNKLIQEKAAEKGPEWKVPKLIVKRLAYVKTAWEFLQLKLNIMENLGGIALDTKDMADNKLLRTIFNDHVQLLA